MGQKVPSGLVKRGNIWHIKKTVCGRRIQESTGTSNLAEAERYMIHRVAEIRNAQIYGIRPKRTFKEAATKYLNEQRKASIRCDAIQLRMLDEFIGHLSLDSIHMGNLKEFIKYRRSQGVKNRTINYALQVTRRILNLAASEWLDDWGLTWLQHPPKIKLLPDRDKKEPYPLSWDEQGKLFAKLPKHLEQMALFAVNTGCREQEICGLQWNMEFAIPELNTSVFIIPGSRVKNRQDRLVVLNSVAKAVVEMQRGKHSVYVFGYRDSQIKSMNNTAWRNARKQAGLSHVRVHDLKHTYGRRLRAADVSFEDRQDLLGHKSSRITTHYSMPELVNLIQASERACRVDRCKSGAMLILKKKARNLRVA